MSKEPEREKENENSNENAQNSSEKNSQQRKKSKKEKKTYKKLGSKIQGDQIKVIPLLKPPSKRRKFDKNGKTTNQENSQSGIIWDNKTIEEQYLERKLHPRIKIDEPKTPYPDGDDEDVYEEGLNKVNEIKPTEELLNNVVASLNENKDKNKSNTSKLKKRAYSNEYTAALKFYNENKEKNEKFENLSGERQICLQNTLINKFHKEVRNLSKGKEH